MEEQTTTLPSPEEFSKALTGLDLHSIYLDQIQATCDRQALDPTTATFSVDAQTFEHKEPGQYQVIVAYELRGRNGDTETLAIDVAFHLTYSAAYPVPDGFLDIFTNNGIPILTMPYLREVVASVTARMGIPTLTLPQITMHPPETQPSDEDTIK